MKMSIVAENIRPMLAGAGIAMVAALAVFVSATAHAQTGAAGSSDWARIVAAAKKEGRVQYYSSPPPQHAQRIAAGFRKAYPDIAIDVVRASTGELMAKIDQERSAGVDGADVWVSVDLAWYQARAKEGSLMKPVGPALAGWPSQAVIGERIVIPSRDPFVIMYNKKLVSDPPRSYADLLKLEFRGKTGLSEASGGISQLAYYLWLEKTQGNDFLEKLRAQNPKIYAGGPQLGQALGAGEIAVAPGVANIAVIKPLMDQGAPVDYVMPNPVFGFQYFVGAFAWSKRPNAALVLLDYLMSTEGQTVWHGTGESASPRPGIPGSLGYSSITAFDPADYPPHVAKANIERWNRIFKQ